MNQIRVNQEVLCSLFNTDTECDQWIHNFSKYNEILITGKSGIINAAYLR